MTEVFYNFIPVSSEDINSQENILNMYIFRELREKIDKKISLVS